jgi:hypothetical protein
VFSSPTLKAAKGFGLKSKVITVSPRIYMALSIHDHINEIKRREAAPTSVPSNEYVNVAWGVSERVVEWTPQPMAFYPSALHTIRLK